VLWPEPGSLVLQNTPTDPPVDGLVADALTYCDMTTSPDGAPVE